MRYYFHLITASLVLTFWSCKDESDEILNKPISVSIEQDSTAGVSSSAQSDSVAVNSVQPVASGNAPKSDLDFSDSAYYQTAHANTMPYRVMTPSGYDSTKHYPLVIFLHGIDERGTDNTKQLKWGASLFKSAEVRADFPSFVIFPQCPNNYYWAENEPMQALRGLIDTFAAKNNVDKNRIYIVGLSMGAYGTYEMVARNPGLFAAAVAISGDGDLKRVSNMAKSDWRIFGGKKDEVVTADKSEKMAHALEKSGANVLLKIYPDANHMGSWVNAFAEPDFCSWMYAVSK